jgi:hypothetical protein
LAACDLDVTLFGGSMMHQFSVFQFLGQSESPGAPGLCGNTSILLDWAKLLCHFATKYFCGVSLSFSDCWQDRGCEKQLQGA